MLTAKEKLGLTINCLTEEQASIYLAVPDILYLLQKWPEEDVYPDELAKRTLKFLQEFNQADLENIVSYSSLLDDDISTWKRQIYA